MLNQYCVHNVSDDDCNKCMKYGIIFVCPTACEYYEEYRMPKIKPIKEDKESEG